MKIKGLVIVFIMMAVLLGSCSKSAIRSAKMKNADDSLAYAFGIVNYNALSADSLELNPMLVARALLDGKAGNPEMSDDVARSYIMIFINKREAKKAEAEAEMNKELYKDYIAENELFLAKNKEKQGVTVTASGLQYEVIKMGKGPKPTEESTVKVHYTGTLVDGTQFDSSVERGEPATFPVTGVISGWTEALQLMPVGSKFKICLPADLAYGPGGASDVIRPYSTLIFEVELLEIVQ
jgi:FKBP-type peptidyl-prolyl cis-trans isomerase